MKKEFSSIVELKSIRERKKQLTERENELTSPLLEDLSVIPMLYDWFKEILADLSCPPNVDSVTQRKKFLFIVLFLYSPNALAGGRLPNGIRNKLSEIFKELSPCSISQNIADVFFIYQQYKDFRNDIESLYSAILVRLRQEKVICHNEAEL